MEDVLVIKPIDRPNLPALQELLQRYFHTMAMTAYPQEVIDAFISRYQGSSLEKLVLYPRAIALGAFWGEDLIGCGWGYLGEPDAVFSLDWVVVRPDVIGRGVFSRIMIALEDRARQAGAWKLFFHVSIKNQPAIRRYQKLGYHVEGVHRNHYFGWDFLSMGKVIIERKWSEPITKQPDAL